jgi:hypothetical protein
MTVDVGKAFLSDSINRNLYFARVTCSPKSAQK